MLATRWQHSLTNIVRVGRQSSPPPLHPLWIFFKRGGEWKQFWRGAERGALEWRGWSPSTLSPAPLQNPCKGWVLGWGSGLQESNTPPPPAITASSQAGLPRGSTSLCSPLQGKARCSGRAGKRGSRRFPRQLVGHLGLQGGMLAGTAPPTPEVQSVCVFV